MTHKDLLIASSGEASLSSLLGYWRLAVSDSLDRVSPPGSQSVGLFSVETPADLATSAVPQGNTSTNKDQGTLVNVRSVGSLYTLITQPTVIAAILAADPADGQNIVTTTTGALYVNLDLLKGFQTTYHVDETNGSDQNYGFFTVAGAASNPTYGPVKSFEEVMRRINISKRTADSSIDIVFDTTADYPGPVIIDYAVFGPGILVPLTINLRGPRTVIATGSLTAVVVDNSVPSSEEIEVASSVVLAVGQLIRFTSGVCAGLHAWVAALTTTGYRLSPIVQPIGPATSMENNFYDISRAPNPSPGDTFAILSNAKRILGGISCSNETGNVNIVDLEIIGFVFSAGFEFLVRCVVRDIATETDTRTSAFVKMGAQASFNDSYQVYSGGITGTLQPEVHGQLVMNGGLITGKVGWLTGNSALQRINSDWLMQGNQAIVPTYSLAFGRAGILILRTRSNFTAVQPICYAHALGSVVISAINGNTVMTMPAGTTRGGFFAGGRDVLGVSDGLLRGLVLNGGTRVSQSAVTFAQRLTCVTADIVLGGKTFKPITLDAGASGFAQIPAINGVDTPGIVVSGAGVAQAGRIHAMSSVVGHVGGSGVYTLTLNDAVPANLALTTVEATAQDNTHHAEATLTSTTTIEVRTYDNTGTLADADFSLVVRDRPNIAMWINEM